MRRLSGPLFAVLLLAGCQSGASKSLPTTTTPRVTTTTVASSTTSTTTSPEVAAERKAAAVAVVTVADAGAGFTGAAHNSATDVDLGPCVEQYAVLNGTAYPTQANGQDLMESGQLEEIDVQSSVRVAPSVAAAETAMATLEAPGVLACLTVLLRPSHPASGVTVSNFAVASLKPPAVGDDVFAYQATFTATDAGTAVNSTADSLVVRTGRVISQLSLLGINVIPTPGLITRLATAMATRARAIS